MAGFFDQKLRLYNSLSWREIFSFDHNLSEMTDDNTPRDLNIYNEVEGREGSAYELIQRPFRIPTIPSQSQS
jgi:hypothetical protein